MRIWKHEGNIRYTHYVNWLITLTQTIFVTFKSKYYIKTSIATVIDTLQKKIKLQRCLVILSNFITQNISYPVNKTSVFKHDVG